MHAIQVQYLVGCGVYIRGKSAIWITRNYYVRRQNYVRRHFWPRGFHMSTVGCDEKVIAEYFRDQERMDIQEDRRLGLGG